MEQKIDNLLKKVRFYQSDRASGKYQVPNEIKDFIQITDQDQLLEEITNKVKNSMQKDLKRVESFALDKTVSTAAAI